MWLKLHVSRNGNEQVGALSIKHSSKLLQETNDRKWLRTTEQLLCVPDVKKNGPWGYLHYLNYMKVN